jgi:hypothetical protein
MADFSEMASKILKFVTSPILLFQSQAVGLLFSFKNEITAEQFGMMPQLKPACSPAIIKIPNPLRLVIVSALPALLLGAMDGRVNNGPGCPWKQNPVPVIFVCKT